MINVAIVEDEQKVSNTLQGYLQKYAEQEGKQIACFCFSNAMDFVSDYTPKYDLVLMDIEMPLMNGYDGAVRLRELDKDVCLVFVTNMVQYAVKGYAVDAMGYMVKPVDYTALAIQMDKVCQRVKSKGYSIGIKVDDGIRRLSLDDLYYVEVRGHYLVYHTSSGNLSELSSLQSKEKELQEHHFFRCTRYALVNLKHVSEVRDNFIVVGGDQLEISRRKRKEFMIAMSEYFR